MGFNINDRDTINALKKGDKSVYTTIYKAYYDKLCRYCFSLSNDDKQVEDIVQDVLIDLWTRREKLNIKTSLNSYLYRAVHNKYIDLYRKETRKHSLINELRIEAIVELEGLEKDSIEVQLSALQKIIDQLPQKRKEIFILSKLNNYKYREIAEMRNISERTVETQIRKAMMTIRKEMLLLRFSGIIVTISNCFYN